MILDKEVLLFLEQSAKRNFSVDRLLTTSFIALNKYSLKRNQLLLELTINDKLTDEKRELEAFISLIEEKGIDFTFELLIKLFEFVISPAEKIVNGAVYTPENIRLYILSKCADKINVSSKIADIACGCGGFLFDFTKHIRERFNKDYRKIFKENIFGIDIASYSIFRTKIILSLLAISDGHDEKEFEFNLHIGNSLEFDWHKADSNIHKNNGFDFIVGNPPYVGTNSIDDDTRKLLSQWKTTSTGKADLYIPFFEIAHKWLSPKGILGYITVSTFLKSVNGRALRNYFLENQLKMSIVDFGGEQVFRGRRTYTCIVIFENKKGDISYTNSSIKSLTNIKSSDFTVFPYSQISPDETWLLREQKFIFQIENTGNKLVKLVDIKNGFATLRNKIYLIHPTKEDAEYYYFSKEDKKYKIEKAICRDAIKPNILKREIDIPSLTEKLIFPYTVVDNFIEVIPLQKFKKAYPFAYKYLSFFRDELLKRDHGNKEYPEWFAFGRTQALNIKGKKLLFPYLADRPHFVYTEDEDLLFYNGFALVSENKETLLLLQKILYSDIFWKYVTYRSRPYENQFFSVAKNYIQNFGIPELTTEEKKYLLKTKSSLKINEFLVRKYQLEGFKHLL